MINFDQNIKVQCERSWCRTFLLTGTILTSCTAITILSLMTRSIYGNTLPKFFHAKWIVDGGIALGKTGTVVLLIMTGISGVGLTFYFSRADKISIKGETKRINIEPLQFLPNLSTGDVLLDTSSTLKTRLGFWEKWLQPNEGVILLVQEKTGIRVDVYSSNNGRLYYSSSSIAKQSLEKRIKDAIGDLRAQGITQLIVKKENAI